MAARADVVLERLVRLDPPHVDGAIQPVPNAHFHRDQPANAQVTSATQAATAATTNQTSLLRATRRR
jgi:hypothetical protein